MDKNIYELISKDREEYIKRLDRIYIENFKCKIVRSICITIILVVYIICYFFTPYLTRNYVQGNNNNLAEGGDINVEDN